MHRVGIDGADIVPDRVLLQAIVFDLFGHVGVRKVLNHAVSLVLEYLVVLLARLTWLAFLDHSHVQARWIKAEVLREGAQVLADSDSLHFLSIEKGLDQDCLTVSDQLLDLKRAHDALNALILDAVDAGDLGHVITVLFGNVCAQLGLLLDNVVEDIRYRSRHILAKLSADSSHLRIA